MRWRALHNMGQHAVTRQPPPPGVKIKDLPEWRRAMTLAEGHDLAAERLRNPGQPHAVIGFTEEDIPTLERTSAKCPALTKAGNPCKNTAGLRTDHVGVGFCAYHKGNTRRERTAGAIMTAHAIAGIMDVSPHEALEISMRRAYTWSAFYQAKLAQVENDEDLLPDGAAYSWVRAAERTTELAAKYAKMCLDAGVAERHVRAVELQGELISKALLGVLHELNLDEATEDRARELLETSLYALAEQGRAKVIVGEIMK